MFVNVRRNKCGETFIDSGFFSGSELEDLGGMGDGPVVDGLGEGPWGLLDGWLWRRIVGCHGFIVFGC